MFSRISNIFIVCIMLIVLGGVFQAIAVTEEEMKAVHQAMTEAFNAHDVEQFLSYLTEDTIHDYVPAPVPVTGKEENRAFMINVFQAFPDMEGSTEHILASGNILVVEWIATGTLEGEWMGMGPTGKGGPTPHLTIFEFEGDKVKRMTTYFDMVTFMVNSGLMPASELPPLEPSFTLPDPEPTGLAPLEATENAISTWNTHDLESYAKLYRTDANIMLAPLGIPIERGALITSQELYFLAFSDIQQEDVRLIDMGDGWVLGEVVYRGTNDGPYFGIPSTGRFSEVRGAWLGRIDADGLITNLYSYWDDLTTLKNLGLFPPPPDTEANKAIVVREFVEVWNQQNLDVIDEIYDPDNVFHDPAESGFYGPEGYRQFVTMYLTAFPDVQFTIEEQIAAGEKVATLWTATGTHQGELMGIPPTDVHATTVGINIAHIVDGQIVEEWAHWDALGQMQQFGVITPGRPAPENYEWGASSEVTGEAGDAEANKAIVVRFIEEAWNQGNLDVIDEIAVADFVAHSPVEPNNPLLGNETSKQVIAAYLAAFPDLHINIEDMFAEGDKVVVRWSSIGTHQGEFVGIPPTGNQITPSGTTIYRFADGKMVENWWAWDALGLMQQLTARPVVDKEAIRELARRGFEEIWNQKNLGAIDELVSPEYVMHDPVVGEVIGTEAFRQYVAGYLTAFPDIQYTLHDIIVEGNLSVVRWTAQGTHLGPFMGVPPSGKKGPGITGLSITRYANGKPLEAWNNWDTVGLLQWLGLIPSEHEPFGWGKPVPLTGDPGDPEANKAVVMRFAEEVFNQKKLDVADELFHPEAISHDPNVSPMEDLSLMKQIIGAYHVAFPDFHVTKQDFIAEGDMVVGRWIITATHQGDFFGIPATGKPVQWTAINMFRFVDGRIAESWWAYDALGILQQIGVVPTGPPEDFSKVFFLSLKSGLNMVSLPLKSITPYTARSFAEELSATVVIKLDETRQRFVGFTLDAPDDGFAIEGGKGYIVNVPKGRVVAFTGAAWTNQPPVEAAAPILAQSDGAWAFVVSGRLEENSQTSEVSEDFGSFYLVTVRNTRTNAVATDVVRKGYFAAAFADLNRKNVVEIGDRLEVQLKNQAGEIVSETLSYTVTANAIRQALLPLTLKNVEIPRQSLLLQNYPNPFNPETWIPYQIREPVEVAIRIYNAQGQLVRTLDLGRRQAGFYLGHSRAAYWDGRNERGERVGSGVYFYHIRAGDFQATRRMLIVK